MKPLPEHLMESTFLKGLVSIKAVDAYIESLHVIIKRFEDVRDKKEEQIKKTEPCPMCEGSGRLPNKKAEKERIR